jgi:hypothetical protein
VKTKETGLPEALTTRLREAREHAAPEICFLADANFNKTSW